MTVGEWIILGVYVVGILGLSYLIKTLKGTVDAQSKTIDAQGAILKEFKDLSATMKTVLDSTNTPQMLERVKAYEEFVDKEKEKTVKAEQKKTGGAIEQGVRIQLDEIATRVLIYA